MRNLLLSIYNQTINHLPWLRFMRREPPIIESADLVRFVDQRAKFIAQTTLYGYLKARAGTRWVLWFEDEAFVVSIKVATWELYLQCLADMAVYATAGVGRTTDAGAEELSRLARHVVHAILDAEPVPDVRPQGFDDARQAFDTRLATIAWAEIKDDEGPFQPSCHALVAVAPVIDDFKKQDKEIVLNSIHNKWKLVRDDFRRLVRAEQVLDDWRTTPTPAGETA